MGEDWNVCLNYCLTFIILFSKLIFSDELKVISTILCSIVRDGAITGLAAETAWSGLVFVDFTFLLPSLALLTVSLCPLPLTQSSLGPLGGGSETPSDPRLRSFHRPLQVLVLHSEGLRHVLPPESVPALLQVLPADPEPLDSGALARLQAATCCSPDVEERRRVRSETGNIKSSPPPPVQAQTCQYPGWGCRPCQSEPTSRPPEHKQHSVRQPPARHQTSLQSVIPTGVIWTSWLNIYNYITKQSVAKL